MSTTSPINPLDHIGLVKRVVTRIAPNADWFLWEELMQEGMIGCIVAANQFDPAKSRRFSTYAVPTIKGAVWHYLRDRLHVIRPNRILKEVAVVYSLDYKIQNHDGSSRELQDTIAAPVEDSRVESVRFALDMLSETDRDAAQMIRLTIGGEDMMRRDAAKLMGVTPVTATRRINRGVEKLKKILEVA